MSRPSTPTVSHTFVGTLPFPSEGEQVLVTVWSDGTAEMAFRPAEESTWGPPHPMKKGTT